MICKLNSIKFAYYLNILNFHKDLILCYENIANHYIFLYTKRKSFIKLTYDKI